MRKFRGGSSWHLLVAAGVLAVTASGCGPRAVKRVRVAGLEPWDIGTIDVAAPTKTDPETARQIRQQLEAAFAQHQPGKGSRRLRLETTVLGTHRGSGDSGALARGGAALASTFGSGILPGHVDLSRLDADLTLVLEGEYVLGDEMEVGQATLRGAYAAAWDEALTQMAQETAQKVGDSIERKTSQYAAVNGGNHRLILLPTSQLLEPRDLAISVDEGLVYRFSVGVARWLQLDFGLGAVPPLTISNLGVKVRAWSEGRYAPGIAVSYDYVSASAFFFFGQSVHLFSLVTEKHLASSGTSLNLGTYFFVTNSSLKFVGTGATTTGWAPFIGAQQRLLGPVSIVSEFMWSNALHAWVLDSALRAVFFELSTVQLRLDAGVFGGRGRDSDGNPASFALPWFGAGLYWM